MKKVIVAVVVSVAVVACSIGIGAAASARSGSTATFETGSHNVADIPVSIKSSWITNSEGYLCLRLDITNNGDKAIRDIQGVFHYTDYGYEDTVVNSYYWPSPAGTTLYVYDADGQDIYGKSKPRIEPGEMLSLVIHKIPSEWISYVYEVRGYITWIDFGPGNNWGTKDLHVPDETLLAYRAFSVEVAPVYGYGR
ncbi:MAG: hypothetical protein FWF18_05930 [Dehalococcoidia bacterium]|nr:hypothetical protein [Dehalococcoidia bacterium]